MSVYKKYPCAWISTKIPLFTTLNITVDLQTRVWEVEGRFIFRLTEFHITDTPVSSWTHFEFKRIIKWKLLNVKVFYSWIQEIKRLDLHQNVEPYFLFFRKEGLCHAIVNNFRHSDQCLACNARTCLLTFKGGTLLRTSLRKKVKVWFDSKLNPQDVTVCSVTSGNTRQFSCLVLCGG